MRKEVRPALVYAVSADGRTRDDLCRELRVKDATVQAAGRLEELTAMERPAEERAVVVVSVAASDSDVVVEALKALRNGNWLTHVVVCLPTCQQPSLLRRWQPLAPMLSCVSVVPHTWLVCGSR